MVMPLFFIHGVMQCVSGMAINHFQPGRGPSPPASLLPMARQGFRLCLVPAFLSRGVRVADFAHPAAMWGGLFISGVAMFKTLAIGALIWLGTSAAAIALLVLQAVLDAT